MTKKEILITLLNKIVKIEPKMNGLLEIIKSGNVDDSFIDKVILLINQSISETNESSNNKKLMKIKDFVIKIKDEELNEEEDNEKSLDDLLSNSELCEK